jgi:RNA polymerase sigma factor (sigma-70 family)
VSAVPSGLDIIRERRSPLISQAARGNPEALETLLHAARPMVYQWALSRTQDLDDAEDVTQAVLLRLFLRLSAFRGESLLSSWIYRVTTNEISGFFRRRAREQDQARLWSESQAHTTYPDSYPDRIDNQRAAGAVRDAASALPPLQQAAFRLVDLDGLRPCEAARELGKTQTTVRSSLCRARRKIRELVEECRREKD